MFYLEDFLEIEKEFPNFTFHLALDRPDPAADAAGVKYTAGFVHQVIYDTYLKDHEAPEDSILFPLIHFLTITGVPHVLRNFNCFDRHSSPRSGRSRKSRCRRIYLTFLCRLLLFRCLLQNARCLSLARSLRLYNPDRQIRIRVRRCNFRRQRRSQRTCRLPLCSFFGSRRYAGFGSA